MIHYDYLQYINKHKVFYKLRARLKACWESTDALSFYRSKTVQIVLEGCKLFLSGPNCFFFLVQIILVRFRLDFSGKFFIIWTCAKWFDPTKTNWTHPKQLVLNQNDLDNPKSFWTHWRTRHESPDWSDNFSEWVKIKVSILGVESLLSFSAWLFPGCKKRHLTELINEVSTRHDMNYGQLRYPTLVDKIINVTKAEPLFGTWSKMVRPKKVANDQKIDLAS